MRALGIIPARGDSEGVKKKNLRLVAGEPLIAYAIRTGQHSSLAWLVIVSDNQEILEVAARLDCPTQSISRELADGPVVDVSRLVARTGDFDGAVLLQPDSPIRLPTDIDACLKMLDDNPDADGVISVYKVEDAHPAHMYRLFDSTTGLGNNWLMPEWSDFEVGRRQSLPPKYLRNGAIYAVRRDALMTEGWIPKRKLGYVMPRELSLTIDTEFDLLMADHQVRLWKEGRLTAPSVVSVGS